MLQLREAQLKFEPVVARKPKAPKAKRTAQASPRAETAAAAAAAAPASPKSPFVVPSARPARSSSFGGGAEAASVRKLLQTAGLADGQTYLQLQRRNSKTLAAAASAGAGSGSGSSSRTPAEEAEFLATQPLSG